MIIRDITEELVQSAAEYPVVTILGSRQSGKTTLARMTFPDMPYFSLEDPDVRMAAEADPRGFLDRMESGGILDEAQRLPALLSYIQGMVDKTRKRGRFILTGSHQPRLHEAISQSLAGRTAMLTLWPFSLHELRRYDSALDAFDLIRRGFFPGLHEEKLAPRRFFNGYLQTYVERDVRALIQLRDLSQFQKFLTLLAGRVGQVVNLASLGNDVGASGTTIRNWLSVLKASYVVFELPPFFENVQKRVIKSPKIYFTDVGLAAFLLGIHTEEQASRDPLRGSLYENFVIADIMKAALNRGIRPEIYFFRDSHGNEVDLLIREKGVITPVEIKSAATFSTDFVKGLEQFHALRIKRVAAGAVLYNGEQTFSISGVRVLNPLHVEDIWKTLISISARQSHQCMFDQRDTQGNATPGSGPFVA
ncbi:MAG: AAA family ATPase [Candidatus Anoxymicrobium japonicum]|uniref:AAA family ATPase n=1 Tax=Candidatus Anoxymicrobium japonicum TaxID=2013648 RepID=A0A2N3G4D2_9ACTN|nr:MAG: AAA family ATPase [Candidatus Anoxymicrobium japonicum]